MEWVKKAYPMGPRSLYGGMDGYILVSLDDITPGLAFNSQPADTYAKWIFNHEDTFMWHNQNDDVTKKIDRFLSLHPKLRKCVAVLEDETAGIEIPQPKYAWFNTYCIPGYGEKFKENEQVSPIHKHCIPCEII